MTWILEQCNAILFHIHLFCLIAMDIVTRTGLSPSGQHLLHSLSAQNFAAYHKLMKDANVWPVYHTMHSY